MKLAILALVIGTIRLTAGGAAAQDGPRLDADARQVTVQGSATVDRAPNQATVNVTIVTNDAVAAAAAGKSTRTYDAFLARLSKLAIPPSAVRTTSYDLQFVPYPPKGLPPEQRQPRYGYVTTRSLAVAVVPLENVGKVIDAATATGVQQVGDVSFDLSASDRRSAYAAALAAAMHDAARNAATLSEAGGFRLGRIRSVISGESTPPPRPFALAREAATAPVPEPPTQIQPNGPIEVNAQVTVTYDIR